MEIPRRSRRSSIEPYTRDGPYQSRIAQSPNTRPLMKRSIFDIVRRQRMASNDQVEEDFEPDFPASTSVRPLHPPLFDNVPQHIPRPNSQSQSIPSLLELEVAPPPPQPLFSPETVNQLRESLRSAAVGLGYQQGGVEWQYEHEQDSFGPSSINNDYVDPSPDYVREEEETKQKIEEIILVAQALREKLDREEELRRLQECEIEPVDEVGYDYEAGPYDYQAPPPPFVNPGPPRPLLEPGQIPSLLDLAPQPPPIPSLLELNLPAPRKQNYALERLIAERKRLQPPTEKCFNCHRNGHSHNECKVPRTGVFCFRCGKAGFNINNCPECLSNRRIGRPLKKQFNNRNAGVGEQNEEREEE